MGRLVKSGLVGCALALLTFTTTAKADLDVTVLPSIAPVPPSPSWVGYVNNAIMALDMGLATPVGSGPTAYDQVANPLAGVGGGTVDLSDIIATYSNDGVANDFNSWLATAGPAAPYAQEYGNRVHFGVTIKPASATRWQFALDNVDWSLTDFTGFFNQSGSFAGSSYSSTRVGISYGADGVRDAGTTGLSAAGDDVIFAAGEPGNLMVDEMSYVGVGNGFEVGSDYTAGGNQADIDAFIGDVTASVLASCGADCPVNFDATYTINKGGKTSSGTGGVDIIIPEPASLSLAMFGMIAGLGFVRRKR